MCLISHEFCLMLLAFGPRLVGVPLRLVRDWAAIGFRGFLIWNNRHMVAFLPI